MKILAADTGTNHCGVAICDDQSILAEISVKIHDTHSKHLLKIVETALTRSGLSISEMDGFAAASGPGSFTGLRIGISTAQGLAMASGKPAVGIPTLDALAWQVSFAPGLIVPLIDARRGEVYFCRRRFAGGALLNEGTDGVMPPEKALEGIDETTLFIGSGALAHREIIEKKMGDMAIFPPPFHHGLRPSTVAGMALEKFKTDPPSTRNDMVPHYIRQPDAAVKRHDAMTRSRDGARQGLAEK